MSSRRSDLNTCLWSAFGAQGNAGSSAARRDLSPQKLLSCLWNNKHKNTARGRESLKVRHRLSVSQASPKFRLDDDHGRARSILSNQIRPSGLHIAYLCSIGDIIGQSIRGKSGNCTEGPPTIVRAAKNISESFGRDILVTVRELVCKKSDGVSAI